MRPGMKINIVNERVEMTAHTRRVYTINPSNRSCPKLFSRRDCKAIQIIQWIPASWCPSSYIKTEHNWTQSVVRCIRIRRFFWCVSFGLKMLILGSVRVYTVALMIGGITTPFIHGRRLSLSSPLTRLTHSLKIQALQIYGLYQTLVARDA